MKKGKVVGIRDSISKKYLGNRVLYHEKSRRVGEEVHYVIWKGKKRYVMGWYTYKPEVVYI